MKPRDPHFPCLPHPSWGHGRGRPRTPVPDLAGTALRAAASASPCPALSRRRASWRRPTGCGKRRSARGCSFSSSCWPRPRRPCSSSSGTRREPSGARCWARRGTRPPRAGPGTGTTSRCVPAPVPGRLRPRGIGVGRGGPRPSQGGAGRARPGAGPLVGYQLLEEGAALLVGEALRLPPATSRPSEPCPSPYGRSERDAVSPRATWLVSGPHRI